MENNNNESFSSLRTCKEALLDLIKEDGRTLTQDRRERFEKLLRGYASIMTCHLEGKIKKLTERPEDKEE